MGIELNRYNFELQLELIGEDFYLNNPATAMDTPRGGHSRGNESYFGRLTNDLKRELECQRIILNKQQCPDSGIFGNFEYKQEEDINWDTVKLGNIIILKVLTSQKQPRYIEVPSTQILVKAPFTSKTKITLQLNDLNNYGEFFGVEYKATKNSSEKSISVASFNSTCPCDIKTAAIKAKMIHSLPSNSRNIFNGKNGLKIIDVTLRITFNLYYFIINDIKECDSRSAIQKIFICNGGFFSPGMKEESTVELSKEKEPEKFGVQHNLYRIKMRYRPFFDSRKIKAKGCGLYTSWEPKIPATVREESERQALLNEVEKISQNFTDEKKPEIQTVLEICPDTENVIYLNLRAERIKKRAA